MPYNRPRLGFQRSSAVAKKVVNPVKGLFRRLKSAGLDEGYVRAWLLPDWWSDEIANESSGVATLEGYIARMTGIPVDQIRSGHPLVVAPSAEVRFKKRQDTKVAEVAAAAAIAERIAFALADAVDLPPFEASGVQASVARQHILTKWPVPDLEAVLDFAWDHGIIVAHMAELPKASKKFDGLTMFVGDRPVVVLGAGRDSPAWMTFDLAHEIGHVLCGHVAPGSEPLSDAGLHAKSVDPQEVEANRFGLELLTGDPEPAFESVYGLRGRQLAVIARRQGADSKIDPGVLALIYGRSADRMGAAQNALGYLDQCSGAHEIVARAIRRHLKDDLPEALRMLINMVTES